MKLIDVMSRHGCGLRRLLGGCDETDTIHLVGNEISSTFSSDMIVCHERHSLPDAAHSADDKCNVLRFCRF